MFRTRDMSGIGGCGLQIAQCPSSPLITQSHLVGARPEAYCACMSGSYHHAWVAQTFGVHPNASAGSGPAAPAGGQAGPGSGQASPPAAHTGAGRPPLTAASLFDPNNPATRAALQ